MVELFCQRMTFFPIGDLTVKKYLSTILSAILASTFALPAFSADVRLKQNLVCTKDVTVSGAVDAPQIKRAVVSLSAANLIAMYTTPVQLLAAPGAGKAIVVKRVYFVVTPTATQFTGGGAVSIKYASGADVTATIAAANVTGASAARVIRNQVDCAVLANTAIQITNATAAFAAGTGTAKAYIDYEVITE